MPRFSRIFETPPAPNKPDALSQCPPHVSIYASFIVSGIQVVKARPGSLILDVALIHADTSTAEQTFRIFEEKVLRAPASTARVQNILQVLHSISYTIFFET